MIVVAIIATLIAIAVPGMLRSRINANEVNAIAALRTIVNGCQGYYANVNPHTYPVTLAAMGPGNADPPYLDSYLAAGRRQGYRFEYTFNNAESFIVRASPVMLNRTGVRSFYADETGIITANANGPAGPNDPAVE